MALAIRPDAVRAGARSHGEVTVRTAPRSAEVVRLPSQPRLTVVAPRRRTARRVTLVCGLLFAVMVGALAFQTQVARGQIELDRIDREIRTAREQYDALRRERAELRSPGHLMAAAIALGMESGDAQPSTEASFQTIDPDVVATVQRMGAVSATGAPRGADAEFAAYAAVKAETGGTP